MPDRAGVEALERGIESTNPRVDVEAGPLLDGAHALGLPVRRNDFAGRLRRARLTRRLTQAELCARAGVDLTAISHFERRGREPSLANLRKLAATLNVSADFLLGLSDEIEADPAKSDLWRKLSRLPLQDLEIVRAVVDVLYARITRR